MPVVASRGSQAHPSAEPGPHPHSHPHRSSATPLTLAYSALIVYASLYPFVGWRVPGLSPWAFLALPWPRWWTAFDLVSNLLGYLPLGALVFGAAVRTGGTARRGIAAALAAGAALSLTMEFTQNFLPQRVPSNVDLALNVAGSLGGGLIGALLNGIGAVERWQRVRDRWFVDRSAGGLALLVLWPAGLLFPTALPLGLGQLLPRLREWTLAALAGTPWSAAAEAVLQPGVEAPETLTMATPAQPAEFSAIALGLLAPCLVAFSVSRPGWRRAVLVGGAAALGALATTLSTALNFGPQHALAWRTPMTADALAVGAGLALALIGVPRRAAAGLGLMALAALAALVAQAPADAYFAESLQAWEQGRFIRFHGVAQWVGWLWPYAAMAYLLATIASREA